MIFLYALLSQFVYYFLTNQNDMKKTIWVLIICITACNQSKNNLHDSLRGDWKLVSAYKADGTICDGFNMATGCNYNPDQRWHFEKDSLFTTSFTGVIEPQVGDSIFLTGNYKLVKEGNERYLNLSYDKFIDSTLKYKKLKIVTLTDSTFEYAKEVHEDGSGGMRFIYRKI